MKKEGQDIHIFRVTIIFGCQHVKFWVFPNPIKQPAAIVKTEIEVLIEGPVILLLTETETPTNINC